MDDSECLPQSHYTHTTRIEDSQQAGDTDARTDQPNNTQLDFWNFGVQLDTDSYSNGQSDHHDDNLTLSISRRAEGSTTVEANEQGPPLVPRHRHRRHHERRARRYWMPPGPEPQPQPQHRPEQEPEPRNVDDPNMGLTDEERRVLDEFDAAIRHARSSAGPSTSQLWGVRRRYGFGDE